MNRCIETERLILRPLTINDVDDVFLWVSDKEVNKYMSYPLYSNKEDVLKWIKSIKEDDNEFGFELKSTGKLIGSGSIKKHEFDVYEPGYNLNREYWNKGYATEATKALIEWAKKELHATRFIACHVNENIASKKVILKCGFIFDKYGTVSKIDGSQTFNVTYYKMDLLEDIYIITGITGYVGNVLAKTLISKGYKVRGLARSKGKLLKVFNQKELEHLDIVYGDIVNKEDIENLLNCEGKKYVIHTAASVSIESKKLTKDLYNINVNGTINVCETCIKNNVKKIIYVSSTNALVTSIKGKIKEPSVYEANKINGGYGKSKALASQYVLDKINNKEINGVIIHPSAIIGPGDYSNTHMNQLMVDFLNHKLPCSIKGNYNFVDVRDVVNIILIMLKNDTKRANYIIASQSESVTNFINIIARYKNRKKIKNVPTILAYIGLPFVRLYCLIRHIRPLYTLYALQTVKENAEFDNSIVKNEFNYNFKSLEESVIDHVEFIINSKNNVC